jgi:hypothetical protein
MILNPVHHKTLKAKKSDYFAALFCFAQRFRCAAAIFSRASALKVRFFPAEWPRFAMPLLVPPRSSRALWRRDISVSISERSSETFMRNSVAQ